MYAPVTHTLKMDHFVAGSLPIAKEALEVKEGETIAARSLVKLDGGKAAAYTADDAAAGTVPYGIAVEEAKDGYAALYLSGEFFGSSLNLPEGVEVDAVKPLLRENGIFLKEIIE